MGFQWSDSKISQRGIFEQGIGDALDQYVAPAWDLEGLAAELDAGEVDAYLGRLLVCYVINSCMPR